MSFKLQLNKWMIPGQTHKSASITYLQKARDQFQQQEVSSTCCQKKQPCLTGGSKSDMEQVLNGCLHSSQVDVAVTVE